MLNKLSMAVDFFTKRPKKEEPAPAGTPTAAEKPQENKPLSIGDPHVQRVLNDFFGSIYWPYIRDLMMQEIIGYQTTVDKQLTGALGDPKDSTGKMAAYHGGRIRGGEEIKLVIARLKKNYGQ